MKKIERVSLGSFGPLLAMRPKGKEVREALEAALQSLPGGGVLVLDFNGVEMMDYSCADEALGIIYSRMGSSEYGEKYLILLEGEDEVSQALMENVEVALSQREVAAITVPLGQFEVLEALLLAGPEPTPGENPRPAGWRVAGRLPDHLKDTLVAVMAHSAATVRDVVENLGLESITACNNRISRLHRLGLVRRKAAIVPEGGRLYHYSGLF